MSLLPSSSMRQEDGGGGGSGRRKGSFAASAVGDVASSIRSENVQLNFLLGSVRKKKKTPQKGHTHTKIFMEKRNQPGGDLPGSKQVSVAKSIATSRHDRYIFPARFPLYTSVAKKERERETRCKIQNLTGNQPKLTVNMSLLLLSISKYLYRDYQGSPEYALEMKYPGCQMSTVLK